MNSNQIKGTAKEVAGKAQRKLGSAIGSTKHQVKGAVTEAEGKAQKGIGKAQDAMTPTRRTP